MPWDTLILSVMLYIVVPVIVAQVWRRSLLARGDGALDRMLKALARLSLAALLLTLVLLFGLQGEQIIHQSAVITMLAVPILIQVYFNAGLSPDRGAVLDYLLDPPPLSSTTGKATVWASGDTA